ncbi:MAG TPA: hypothetical protein VMD25_13510 [Acidobacteriaceae bacterium]|nr:hypothetical protein [Acidobacteriaceae bacterium]
MRKGIDWRRARERDVVPNPVNFSLPPGCSDADVIRRAATEFNLRIDTLPQQLEERKHPRGKSFLGAAADLFDGITLSHPGLRWSKLTDGVLRFASGTMRPLNEFDLIAGRLMYELKSNRKSYRLSSSEWLSVARELDAKRLSPLDHLEPAQKEKLDVYNRNQRIQIQCWAIAFQRSGRRVNDVRRALKQRLNRACDRYQKSLNANH